MYNEGFLGFSSQARTEVKAVLFINESVCLGIICFRLTVYLKKVKVSEEQGEEEGTEYFVTC